MNTVLWLDNDANRAAVAYRRFSEERRQSTIWCRQVSEAIDILKSYQVDEVHLGHNLSDEPNLGACRNCTMQLVNWVIKNASRNTYQIRFIVHTHESAAGFALARKLRKNGFNSRYVPFGGTEIPLS